MSLFTLTKFEEKLFDAESFGSGRAKVTDVTLIDSRSEKPIYTGIGGEKVTLRIEATSHDEIVNPIVGFLLKNERGLVLLGDNTLNQRTNKALHDRNTIKKGTNYQAEFEFTLPLLPSGKYSFTVSLAEGNQELHTQLQWKNDALILECLNTSIAAGLAGVPMHRITLDTKNHIK